MVKGNHSDLTLTKSVFRSANKINATLDSHEMTEPRYLFLGV